VNRRLAFKAWLLPVIWHAESEPPRAIAARPAPQVTLTVVRVEAGAHVSFGGVSIAPIIPAPPQQRAAVTTETEE
jgi:hypothetical protein